VSRGGTQAGGGAAASHRAYRIRASVERARVQSVYHCTSRMRQDPARVCRPCAALHVRCAATLQVVAQAVRPEAEPSRARAREVRGQRTPRGAAPAGRERGLQRLSLTTRLWNARMWVDGDSVSLDLFWRLWFCLLRAEKESERVRDRTLVSRPGLMILK